ncbi:MAG TPA: NUDIX hydrolase [Nevskiaceae bacterium]|nr:NUDIX hydrolase [Nevskiaceae bacterium]
MKGALGDKVVERRITPVEEIKEKYVRVGTVVFILNENGELLVIRENFGSKITGKNPGDFGVLCETTEEGEEWKQTLMRGLREELAVTDEEIEKCFVFNPDCCFLGESIFVEGVLVRVTVIGCRNDIFLGREVSNNEVSIIGWEQPEKLISYPLRIGVRKILQECLDEGLLERNTKSFLERKFLSLSLSNLREARDIQANEEAL